MHNRCRSTRPTFFVQALSSCRFFFRFLYKHIHSVQIRSCTAQTRWLWHNGIVMLCDLAKSHATRYSMQRQAARRQQYVCCRNARKAVHTQPYTESLCSAANLCFGWHNPQCTHCVRVWESWAAVEQMTTTTMPTCQTTWNSSQLKLCDCVCRNVCTTM